MNTVVVVHPFGDYQGPPLEMPRPAAGYVLSSEYALRTAHMLLSARPQEDCEEIGAELLGAVGYAPPRKRDEPEPPPRFWPVQETVLRRAVELLDRHGGSVSEALARQFDRSLRANAA